jgi:thioredoxin reductase
MCLKSEPYGSVFARPGRGHDLADYCKEHGYAYAKRLGPVTLERFLGYADWFAERLVPQVDDLTATRIATVDGGFRLEFGEAAPIVARQVVLATGLLPYVRMPAELSGLPTDLVTHSSAHHRLEQFRSKKIAVIGAGQSALETAALAQEAGANVQIIARKPEIAWADPLPEHLSIVDYIKRPPTRLCEGWRCAFWYTPPAFRHLPVEMQVRKAHSVLGPMGSWWLRERVDGVIETLTSHRVLQATPEGSGVRLLLNGPEQSSIKVDHVVAGTGFRVDLSRLSFLSEELHASIATRDYFPIVNRAGESSISGLYFAGAHTAVSLGPGMRFVAGTHRIAAVLARSVARQARAGKDRPLPGSLDTGPALAQAMDNARQE